MGQAQASPATAGISSREAEVLAGIAEHLTNAEIAAKLFISVRTVESHVSSLLRKFGVNDRRALAGVAPAGLAAPSATLPSPLTPFVGRAAERAELAAALGEHRLVTAVGPGGVGKTRLALAVAADVTERYTRSGSDPAGVIQYVDLVPVTDHAMVAPTVAAALGLGEQQGRSAEQTVLGWLAGRAALLILDNCEHLVDGVVVLLERMLAGCPRLTVLATSRARLLVPYEWVFAVPGLSVAGDEGDAVELFLGRAAAAGRPLDPQDRGRVAAICRGLDGMALAIELAAARLPALGLDGLEAGLADRLQLLAGGRRIDDRHRSLRSTLDWSYALLAEAEQAVLRRISVFAAPFTAEDAAAVIADWPPVSERAVASALAALADQSLLLASASPYGTRYRALETIRQYGQERLAEAGEQTEAQARHLRRCLGAGVSLGAGDRTTIGWRSAFDTVADELRAALGWAAAQPEYRAEAYRLAVCLAELSFSRGLPGESQRRYEQAAELAGTPAAAAKALHCAAGAALTRQFGGEALRLHRAAADAALRAGDRPRAAYALAQMAELINRGPGVIPWKVPANEVQALIAEAKPLTDGDPAAEARVANAEAAAGSDADAITAELTERALVLARQAGDPLTESAALDQLTAVQLARGEIRAAATSARLRTELLAPLPVRADTAGIEVPDAYAMATETAVAAGDLRAARRFAEQVRDLPFYREEGHLGTARLLLVTALAGDWDETVVFGERFLEGWERAGRPRTGNLSRGAYAAATVHGLRGDNEARATWLEVAGALSTPGRPDSEIHHGEFFDAILFLHYGQGEEALRLLVSPPWEFQAWYSGLWRPWYAAVWVEAAVLAGSPEAADRIEQARSSTADNPIATAIVDRAEALARGDRDGVLAAAAALQAAGCRYQWARSLVLAGGTAKAEGESALAAMGATVAPRE